MEITDAFREFVLDVYDAIPNSVKTVVGHALSAGLYVMVFVFLESMIDGMAISAALTFALRAALRAFLDKLPLPDKEVTTNAKSSKRVKYVAKPRLQLKDTVA